MVRLLLLTTVVACGPGSTDATDATDATDDTDPPPACAYDDLVGRWVGSGMQENLSIEFDIDLTIGEGDVGETIGIWTQSTTNRDPPLECSGDFVCTGSEQNDWRVVLSHSRTDVCFDGFAFLRLEDAEHMALETAQTELGARITSASLVRAD